MGRVKQKWDDHIPYQSVSSEFCLCSSQLICLLKCTQRQQSMVCVLESLQLIRWSDQSASFLSLSWHGPGCCRHFWKEYLCIINAVTNICRIFLQTPWHIKAHTNYFVRKHNQSNGITGLKARIFFYKYTTRVKK